MNWAPEDLMAYADGQMPAPAREALERDLARDDALRKRVDALRAQRTRVASAYADVIDEPVPDRLSALLEKPAPPATALAAVREDNRVERGAANDGRWRMSWAAWGGMAACLVLGVVIGMRFAPDGSPLSERNGQLVADGALSQALSTRLAGDSGDSPVRTPISFVDHQGRYCRAFTTAALAGIACHEGGRWDVVDLAAGEPRAPSSAMRQAASALPPSVLEAVDRRIAGGALDAQAERLARDQGWRR
jgi:hypothetical protein